MQVVLTPDNRLRVKTKPVKKVTPQLINTIRSMVDLTKSFVDPEGVGLASTQIGEDGQYFVIKLPNNKFKAFFNPKVLKYSKKIKQYLEGCLSIPSLWGEVNRAFWVDVSYVDISGQRVDERLSGVVAWIFQHETDHLSGKLFVDRVLEQKGRLYKVVGKDRAGNEIFEEIKL